MLHGSGFEHVLLPKIVEKGVFTSQNRQNSLIFPKKNKKKLSGKSAHLFSIALFGVSSNGWIKSNTSSEKLVMRAF